MKVLLIQPNEMELTNNSDSGIIYNIMREAGFDITIGTTKSKANKINVGKLITKQSKIDYNRIVMLSGNMDITNSIGFDDKMRCLYALKNSNCPIIFIQNDYITKYVGYPAMIKRLGNTYNFNKDKKIKVLLQCKYPDILRIKIRDLMNYYTATTTKYNFINWGTHHFKFKESMMKPKKNPEYILSYIEKDFKNNKRLSFINNKRTNRESNNNILETYNNSIATIFTNDDSLIGESVETASLYKGIRSGTVLLVDELMFKNQDDCYLNGLDCFYSTKKELWEKVSKLYKNKDFRLELIEAQQNRLYNTINLNKIKQQFIKLFD